MEQELLKLGYLELACYLRAREQGFTALLPELSLREAEQLRDQAYEDWKSRGSFGGPGELGARLGLSEGGVFALLLAGLSLANDAYREALILAGPTPAEAAVRLFYQHRGLCISRKEQDIVSAVLWLSGRRGIAPRSVQEALEIPMHESGLADLFGVQLLPEWTEAESGFWSEAAREAKRLLRYEEAGGAFGAVLLGGPAGAGKQALARAWGALGTRRRRVLLWKADGIFVQSGGSQWKPAQSAIPHGEWTAGAAGSQGQFLVAERTALTDNDLTPCRAAVLSALFGAGLCVSGMDGMPCRALSDWAVWLRERGLLLFVLLPEEADAAACAETDGAGGKDSTLQDFTVQRPEAEYSGFGGTFRLPHLPIELHVPDTRERRRVWERAAANFSVEADISFEMLAGQYVLTPGQILRVLQSAARDTVFAGRKVLTRADILAGCHRLLRRNFGPRASKLLPLSDLSELVLPAAQKAKLAAAAAQVQLRGRVLEDWGLRGKMPYGTGVSLIFAGPPGTGKTMAARILAGQLGMELYRVELSAVVSKYIGETEKNLEQIFEAARRSQTVLLFDEADALFGQRIEVRDSNDKYSNMEAAFLLQKMEEYEGVAILATNLLKNIDEAFKRRMKFIIDFPFPGKRERLELWKRAVPAEVPRGEELDLAFLAERFELSGSNIRNIVYHACFLAAANGAGGSLGMRELMRALKNEYEKSGKALTREEAGPYGDLLREGRD